MRNQLKYLLVSSLIVGCTVNNVEKSDTGGGANGGGSSTGGAAAQSGGTTNKAGATSVGGSSVAGGSTSVGGTSAVGGSTDTATGGSTSLGGTSAVGGSTETSVGGTTATGGATGTSVGGTAATGGTSSTSTGTATGGTTGVSTATSTGGTSSTGGSGGGTGLTTIKLDPSNDDCLITAPTTWVKAVYDTSSCVSVTVSSALTIQAGAIIKFTTIGYMEAISTTAGVGTITAVGTANDPIIFTSMKDDAHGGDTNGDGATTPSTADWGSLGTSGDLNLETNGSQIDHVQFLYGSEGLWVQGSSTKVTNSVFAHNLDYGLVLDGRFPAVKSTTVTGNTFFDTDGFPLSLGYFVSIDASNIFHDPANPATKNTMQCIEIGDTILDAAVTLGVTELSFYGDFEIASALTVANNVSFKPKAGGEIDLDAAGSIVNGANAIFTSYLDDAVAGDCLGDGALTPAAGDWRGIWVAPASGTPDWATPTANIRYTDQVGFPGTMPLH